MTTAQARALLQQNLALRWMTGSFATLPGLALAGGMALCAFLLQRIPALAGISPAILAVVLGLGMRCVLVPSAVAAPGLQLSKSLLLRCAVALLGLRVTFSDILGLGFGPVLAVAAGLAGTFVTMIWIGRLLRVEPSLARLLAVGTSVCGASAIGAARALSKDGDDDQAPYAVIVITILGTACLILFPLLASLAGLPDRLYALWVGASLHEVAQAVAAGAQRGADTAVIATLAKMERVLLLAPLLIFVALGLRNEGRTAGPLAVRWVPPWFLFAFMAGATVQSLGWVPTEVSGAVIELSSALMAMALAAMGIGTDLRSFLRRGFRPVLLTVLGSAFLGVVSLALLALLD